MTCTIRDRRQAVAHDAGTAMTALDRALALASRGVPCFPCLTSKAPACAGGFKAATADREQLRRLWRAHPGDLIGVPSGPVSGIDALDIDPRHGGDIWLAANRHRLPPTRTHATRAGGLHVLFRAQAGLRNSAGRIASGVDVRADGGYVVWWPATGLPLAVVSPVAPWPDWLLETLQPPVARAVVAVTPLPAGDWRRNRYLTAAVRSAVETVARAGEGCRNVTLNRETHGLARFIVTGDLSLRDVVSAMACAAAAAGLSEPEIRATIGSAVRAQGASA